MKPSSRRKAAPAQPAMVSVTLMAEHEHLGSVLQPGAAISVHPDTAQWLEAMGVAAPAPSTTQTPPQPVNTKD
ncbi:hypothetical protein CTR2_R32350 [Comamonas thiooxydans]|uniref:DUF7210 family protein n=1 Tax=Comamonas thiooxydans TaxID=363952 RepID=UPI000A2D7E7E|nr:hypothetical protein [Comamonas thiooxydans]BDR09897.1 hypothetical protein CTR2_R32350 [Comamonas thiooxydans]